MQGIITSFICYDLGMEVKPMPSTDVHKGSAEAVKNKIDDISEEFTGYLHYQTGDTY